MSSTIGTYCKWVEKELGAANWRRRWGREESFSAKVKPDEEAEQRPAQEEDQRWGTGTTSTHTGTTGTWTGTTSTWTDGATSVQKVFTCWMNFFCSLLRWFARKRLCVKKIGKCQLSLQRRRRWPTYIIINHPYHHPHHLNILRLSAVMAQENSLAAWVPYFAASKKPTNCKFGPFLGPTCFTNFSTIYNVQRDLWQNRKKLSNPPVKVTSILYITIVCQCTSSSLKDWTNMSSVTKNGPLNWAGRYVCKAKVGNVKNARPCFARKTQSCRRHVKGSDTWSKDGQEHTRHIKILLSIN